MIKSKYTDQLYTISPLTVATDFCQAGLEQALIELKYKIGSKYTLHLGREHLRDIINLTGGLQVFSIKLEIEDDLRDDWYLVDEEAKMIKYSPGA